MSDLKRTSLYETHRAAGATLVPFAGWEMPVSYPLGTVKEVAAVRHGVGLFDVSHMGQVRVTGPNALAYVQSVTTNDAHNLDPDEAQYSLLLNDTGGIIDDIIVYCWRDMTPDAWNDYYRNEYLLVVNAGCKDKDWAWLNAHAHTLPGVTLTDDSDHWALLAVQGPGAVALVERVTQLPLAGDRFTFSPVCPPNWTKDNITLYSRTGYTGEDGFEIFCPWDDAPALWAELISAGAVPCGLGARDVLRLEAAYPLYGHELDADHAPAESGVGWAMKAKKGAFIGRDAALARPKTQTLVGLRMDERAIPREGYAVLDTKGETIGAVTSGTYSPTVQAGIAMARVDRSGAAVGTRVDVEIRGRRASAHVVALPFYRNGV